MIDGEVLLWDAWNVDHIARHGVTREQVEEVCLGNDIWVRESYNGRIMVVGATLEGDLLSVVLAPERDGYYVVTARPASRRERRLYRSGERGES